ncbi:MAG: murein biosynthesis integral membrane protein MurJ [Alphaproteobacteria bacterium]
MSLFRSSATVGGYTLISRVLGFLRDLLIAAVLGTSPVADAFFVAFRIPNLFRRLTGEGAFNAAFVPVFAGLIERDGRPAAEYFAGQVLSIMILVLAGLTLLAEAAMPWVIMAIAPGFIDDPDKFDLAVTFTRLTFPYLLLVSLMAILGAVLNAMMRFAAAAAAPILLNIVMIAMMLTAMDAFATPGHALALGVTLGGVAQLALMVVACRRAGVAIRPVRPRLTPQIRRWLRLMGPGLVGAGVLQINLLAGTIIASLLPTGAISYLYYADRVNQLPLGVVGVAIGTALLPMLSRRLKAGDEAGGRAAQNRALELGLFFTLPAAAALMIVPEPMIGVLFERGAFSARATTETSQTLAAFAVGLPAYVLVRVLAPGFFAREDTVTPVRIAALAVAANIMLSLALVFPFGHVGIAAATSLASWLNAVLLALTLRRRGHLQPDLRLRDRLWRIVLAVLVMVGVLLLVEGALAPWFQAGPARALPALALLVGAGGLGFALAATAFGAARLSEIRHLLRPRASLPGESAAGPGSGP